MEKCDINVLMCMNFDKEKLLPLKLPQFYKDVITSWHLCSGCLKAPQGEVKLRSQLIWGIDLYNPKTVHCFTLNGIKKFHR